MSEHFGDIFDGNPVGKSNRSGERVPSGMTRYFLRNTAYISEFNEISVHLLIAQDREQYTPFETYWVVFISVKDLFRGVEQGDVAHIPRLLTFLPDPQRLVVVSHDVFGLQTLDVRERKTVLTTKYKSIPHLSKT
jgi:hypothetical protein